jgi:hypothetical protein
MTTLPLINQNWGVLDVSRIVYGIDEDRHVVHVLDIEHLSVIYYRPQRG